MGFAPRLSKYLLLQEKHDEKTYSKPPAQLNNNLSLYKEHFGVKVTGKLSNSQKQPDVSMNLNKPCAQVQVPLQEQLGPHLYHQDSTFQIPMYDVQEAFHRLWHDLVTDVGQQEIDVLDNLQTLSCRRSLISQARTTRSSSRLSASS